MPSGHSEPQQVMMHASAVALGGHAVLLRGPSGAGKSDLALRLIDEGGRLVADDQVLIRRAGAGLLASAPDPIAGMMEVRGLGLVRLPHAPAPVGLLVDLTANAKIERLPDPQTETILGVAVPLVAIDPFAVAAAARVRMAVAVLVSGRAPLVGQPDRTHYD